jgi:hypothetical protein
MTSSPVMQRRMAALFVLAIALLAWQAPRTPPTSLPPSVTVTVEGEQLFPLAVPDEALPALPADAADRRAFLTAHAVTWDLGQQPSLGDAGAGACRLFLRVSAQHWAVRTLDRSTLLRLAGTATSGAFRLEPADFLDDDDGDGDPLDAGELHRGGAGAEAEVDCAP